MDVIHVHVIIAALQPLLDKDNDESNDPTGLTTCHLKYRSRNSPCLHLSSKLAFNLSHSGSIATLADVFHASDQLIPLIPRTSIMHQGSVTSNPSRDPPPWDLGSHPQSGVGTASANLLHSNRSTVHRYTTSLAFPFPDSGRRFIELGNFDKCLPSCVAITEAL
jgi:hypothetical protein